MTEPCPFSDHCAVVLRVAVPCPFPRGPGRWKLNISLLADDAFLEAVERLWVDWRCKKGSFRSLLQWWDEGKRRIKGLCVRFGVAHSRERAQVVQQTNKFEENARGPYQCRFQGCENDCASFSKSKVNNNFLEIKPPKINYNFVPVGHSFYYKCLLLS